MRQAIRLLQKQYDELIKDTTNGFSIGLEKNSYFDWSVCFEGPEGCPYANGIYSASLQFPENFPLAPPVMKFKNEMFHPNIYPCGTVCISILHKAGSNDYEKPEEQWRPIISVEAVLSPNLESPANVDAAKMLRENPEEYKKRICEIALSTIM